MNACACVSAPLLPPPPPTCTHALSSCSPRSERPSFSCSTSAMSRGSAVFKDISSVRTPLKRAASIRALYAASLTPGDTSSCGSARQQMVSRSTAWLSHCPKT
eukprot:361885-Chlamydomonas_euryale.AAC.3